MAALLPSGTVLTVHNGLAPGPGLTYQAGPGQLVHFDLGEHASWSSFSLDPAGEFAAVATLSTVTCFRLEEGRPPTVWFVAENPGVSFVRVRKGVVAGCRPGHPCAFAFFRDDATAAGDHDSRRVVCRKLMDMPGVNDEYLARVTSVAVSAARGIVAVSRFGGPNQMFVTLVNVLDACQPLLATTALDQVGLAGDGWAPLEWPIAFAGPDTVVAAQVVLSGPPDAGRNLPTQCTGLWFVGPTGTRSIPDRDRCFRDLCMLEPLADGAGGFVALLRSGADVSVAHVGPDGIYRWSWRPAPTAGNILYYFAGTACASVVVAYSVRSWFDDAPRRVLMLVLASRRRSRRFHEPGLPVEIMAMVACLIPNVSIAVN